MSIGANWRQISPGEVSGAATQAGNKFAQSNAADQLSETAEGRTFSEFMFGEDGFEFTDLLDVVNPLQHIPGVGMVYRSMTGDELGNGARVVGGGLFGGVFGLAGAAIDAVVDAFTGEDTGSHIMAFVDDSFGGESGTAVADATKPPATANTTVAAAGGYQGELVLPWMAGEGAQNGMPASPAEQSTIVQSAPTAPVDQMALASASQVAPPTVSPSDLNVPWANARVVESAAINPQAATQSAAQAPVQPQMAAQRAEAPEPREVAEAQSDPAALSVAMASAGTSNPLINKAQSAATVASSRNPVRPATFSSEGGDTVWARAASTGRISRQTSTIAISAEMAAHEAKYAKREAVMAEAQSEANRSTNVATPDLTSGGAPLSAAEMAARFNAALGREKAQSMAADAAANATGNPTSDQRMTANNAGYSQNDSANMQAISGQNDMPKTHPLMERANTHIGSEQPVGAWFSQTMMDGLKKYQAMQQQSRPSGNSI